MSGTETQLVLVGAAILAVIIIGTFTVAEITAPEKTKEFIETNLGLSVPIVEGLEKAGKAIDKAVEENEAVYGDLLGGKGIAYAEEDYFHISAGDNAFKWLQLFGANIYNDGFASFHYSYLQENAEAIAKIYGDPQAYMNKYGNVGMVRKGLNARWRLSPFEIRQNLDKLPFSKNLHGVFGSSATSLKESIWTDWDKFPEQAKIWYTLDAHKREKIKEEYAEDKNKYTSLLTINSYQAWIVRDRILAFQEIADEYKIVL